MKLNITKKGDANHADLFDQLKNIKAVQIFNYNEVVKAYNDQDVESILDFPFDAKLRSSFLQQMERRGLIVGVDYTFAVSDYPVLDADGNEIIKKDAAGKPVPQIDPKTNRQALDENNQPIFEIVTESTAFFTKLTDKKGVLLKRGGRGSKVIEVSDSASSDDDGQEAGEGDEGAQPGGPIPEVKADVSEPDEQSPAKATTAPAKPQTAAKPPAASTGKPPAKPAGNKPPARPGANK